MATDHSNQSSLTWLAFAMLTVLCWGVYGVFLHKGQTLMQPAGARLDPATLRYKAFLFVGLAYFLTAVLAPLALLMAKGAAFTGYTTQGMSWSLVAGIAGAAGAFGVLLAFGARGTPAVVMAIVFAGAPIVNALYSLYLHPPHGGWSAIKPQFYAGIALAALGGCLVTYYKPASPAPSQAMPQVNTPPPAHPER
jgi:drug/metabolite transporter (DMT)-like permease